MKFYRCVHCGKIIVMLHETPVPTICCGEPMQELKPGVIDAVVEKHLPVVTSKCGRYTVSVGEVAHPMIPEHYIQWICFETQKGFQQKYLQPGDEPQAVFALSDDKPVAVYEYCNLHGLWMTKL